MKKTLAIAAVAATMMTAAIPAKANDQWLGPLLGGVAGGFVGNQFGKGTGKTAATALGAVGGVLLGQQLQRRPVNPNVVYTQPQVVYSQPQPTVGAIRCTQYRNPAARAQCNRGVADRLRAYQRAVERQAYQVGRGTYGTNHWGIGQRVNW
jgi:uncharacterized protein YcfJ